MPDEMEGQATLNLLGGDRVCVGFKDRSLTLLVKSHLNAGDDDGRKVCVECWQRRNDLDSAITMAFAAGDLAHASRLLATKHARQAEPGWPGDNG